LSIRDRIIPPLSIYFCKLTPNSKLSLVEDIFFVTFLDYATSGDYADIKRDAKSKFSEVCVRLKSIAPAKNLRFCNEEGLPPRGRI
jgi:hypothetical protein